VSRLLGDIFRYLFIGESIWIVTERRVQLVSSIQVIVGIKRLVIASTVWWSSSGSHDAHVPRLYV
jgi:hypothetical protein